MPRRSAAREGPQRPTGEVTEPPSPSAAPVLSPAPLQLPIGFSIAGSLRPSSPPSSHSFSIARPLRSSSSPASTASLPGLHTHRATPGRGGTGWTETPDDTSDTRPLSNVQYPLSYVQCLVQTSARQYAVTANSAYCSSFSSAVVPEPSSCYAVIPDMPSCSAVLPDLPGLLSSHISCPVLMPSLG